jgi:hypothetical protein
MKMLLASGIVAMSAVAGSANAERLYPTVTTIGTGNSDTVEQVMNYLAALPPDVWLKVMRKTVRVSGLTDTPDIAVFNTGREEVNRIVCDGYTFSGVGADKSVEKWNSGPIPGRSVVIEHANKWDGYCKDAILAQTDSGDLMGVLDQPGNFTGSTNLILREKQ